MKRFIIFYCFLLIGINCKENSEKNDDLEIQGEDEAFATNTTNSERKQKLFSFLQVMKFPNTICPGATRNGTCYSSDECASKGGTASGNCANGFGVCCVFILGCGQTTSDNNSYLVLASTTSPTPSPCTYTICECSSSICRIRLDFTTFSINGPVTGSTIASNTAPATAGQGTATGGAIGDCNSDQFSVTAPNNKGSPIICGINTGQHMMLDTTNGNCAKVNFDFGAAAFSRSYDIRVTQFNCGDEMAGPPDCLQYFTSSSGTVGSFNFPINSATTPVGATTTHLSNQNYNMCFRRNQGKCAICFTPVRIPAAPTIADQQSFGLSTQGVVINTAALSAGGEAKSALDTICSTDYLIIPNGGLAANAIGVSTPNTATTNTPERFCGRGLNPATDIISSAVVSVCSGQRPFKITFVTDQNEAVAIATAAIEANGNEMNGVPGGIIGFNLAYTQLAC